MGSTKLTGVRIVTAGERVDRLEFSDADAPVVHLGAYCCPRCSFRVEFRTKNLRRHECAKWSNLDSEWRDRFEAARPLELARWQSFLDFHCPGCKAPVRIVYEPGDEYAMGCHSWRVLEVLEAAEWPQIR